MSDPIDATFYIYPTTEVYILLIGTGKPLGNSEGLAVFDDADYATLMTETKDMRKRYGQKPVVRQTNWETVIAYCHAQHTGANVMRADGSVDEVTKETIAGLAQEISKTDKEESNDS
jgi:hypothetical protein